jgi:serine/threonine-protein kinase
MTDRAAPPQPGDTVADKYRIESMIGSGGMSVVFGATHLITGRRFAIKWLSPVPGTDVRESTQRFIREAQVANRFTHPNVVEVYDVGETRGAYYMVMEWLDGESLAAKLERDGTLPFEKACELLVPCMLGIDDAHSAGIIHRDLKPANIFLCAPTRHAPLRAKVLDFGVSKLLERARGGDLLSPVVTKSGMVVGTPYYLAPEQLRSVPVDQRSDVYAFGVILYQVLSGAMPFPSENFAELVVQIATGTPTPLRELVPTLPPSVEHIVAKAMARDPDERYPDVRSLVSALELPLAQLARAARSELAVASTATRAIPRSTPMPMGQPPSVVAELNRVRDAGANPRVMPLWGWVGTMLLLVVLGAGIYELWGIPSVARVEQTPAGQAQTQTQAVQAAPGRVVSNMGAQDRYQTATGAEASQRSAAQNRQRLDPAAQPVNVQQRKKAPIVKPAVVSPDATAVNTQPAPAPVAPQRAAPAASEANRNPLHMQLQ